MLKETKGLLNAYVANGLVDYASIRKDPSIINQVSDYLRIAPINTFGPSELKAFYINAYNLIVIKQIADHYPVTSPMDISGFFDRYQHEVGGELLTLNELENERIRKVYADQRVHFVLVCAAVGCPLLASEPFRSEKIEQQLDNRTRKTLNDPTFLRSENHTILLSEIFKWYRDDFPSGSGALINWINGFLDAPLNTESELEYYSYDWSLNDGSKGP